MDESGDHETGGGGLPPESDGQRGAPRFSLLIRTAKLVYPFGEYLCIVRDVSATGVRLRVFHPLPGHKRAEIELANGARHSIELVWEEDGHAGFQFPGEIDVHSFINEASHWSRRPIRLKLTLPGVLTTDDGARVAWVLDLSQHGARIECAHHLAVKQKVKLEAEGLPPLIANIAWRSSPHYGLAFQQTFTFEALAKLAAGLSANGEEEQPSPDFRKGIA